MLILALVLKPTAVAIILFALLPETFSEDKMFYSDLFLPSIFKNSTSAELTLLSDMNQIKQIYMSVILLVITVFLARPPPAKKPKPSTEDSSVKLSLTPSTDTMANTQSLPKLNIISPMIPTQSPSATNPIWMTDSLLEIDSTLPTNGVSLLNTKYLTSSVLLPPPIWTSKLIN